MRWRNVWRARRDDAKMLAVILPLFALLFGPVILRGKSFALYDAFAYSYPLRELAWNTLRRGELPLWTPLVMSGYPLLSMAQLALGYPLTWGYVFLPGYIAEQVYILAPYLLTPAFVYAYARQIERGRLASLLAGLAYGFGGLGINGFPHNGLLTNAMMWLPLVLVAIERARTRSFASCLLGATAAYAMSVLTGIGQGFLYTGLLAALYACFIALTANTLKRTENDATAHDEWLAWRRWRPLAVAVSAIMLSAGVAAFQILETLPAAALSIRSTLSYRTFTDHSFTLIMALRSLFAPIGPSVYFFDASAYVAAFALLIAICAVAFAVKGRPRDARIFFWALVAITGWVLMLGVSTPLYPLLYRVPLVNRFRYPPRHAFEWTFAVSILSAYGWDALSGFFSRTAAAENQRRRLARCFVSLAFAFVAGACWFATAGSLVTPPFHESRYLLWKSVFTVLVLLTVWQGWRLAASRRRTALLATVIALACFAEPLIIVTGWWWTIAKPLSRFTTPSTATHFLRQFAPEQNRIYTRVPLFTEEYETSASIDPPNLTARYGLQNIAGYEPLIMQRYSRALGGVGMDATTPLDGTLFDAKSHVLDLLNDRFVVTYSDPHVPGNDVVVKQKIRFPDQDEKVVVSPNATRTLMAVAAEGDALALVTSLAYSASLATGTPVARVRIVAANGEVIERELRAGIDTSEWAHERADVRPTIRHTLAPVFDSKPGDADNTFPSNRYWTRLSLDRPLPVDRVEITSLTTDAELVIWKAVLYDSGKERSMPLEHVAGGTQDLDLNRWQTVYNQRNVRIFRNERALPRVWLTMAAEAVDEEEALRMIRGESARSFDPARIALLEIPPDKLPALPDNDAPANATAQGTARLMRYEPNRIAIETVAETPAVLVASEINYPGWAATIDGGQAPIYQTDYLLRGMILPAGHHTIEMRYTAPSARKGAFISLVSLLLIGVIALHTWRHARATRRLPPA
ncbi:MAG: hypothetical protein ABR577_09560 [Pyrinomonadaceae bacterium]